MPARNRGRATRSRPLRELFKRRRQLFGDAVPTMVGCTYMRLICRFQEFSKFTRAMQPTTGAIYGCKPNAGPITKVYEEMLLLESRALRVRLRSIPRRFVRRSPIFDFAMTLGQVGPLGKECEQKRRR